MASSVLVVVTMWAGQGGLYELGGLTAGGTSIGRLAGLVSADLCSSRSR
ncbi:hypothetical protein ABZS66_16625 [Dactylosporangium sp. NPDC005572]